MMKSKIILSLALFLLLFSVVSANATTLTPEEREELLIQYEIIKKRLDYLKWYVQKFDLEKEINATSYLVTSNTDSSTLLQKESDLSRPIASITKLMTAVIASENIDANRRITLGQEMFLVNSYQRHSPAIYPGTTLLASDLLKACLIQSTNNAAQSLAYSLTEKEFIRLMNQKAKEIGMKTTFFSDAHGLSSQNISSAKDLTILLNYISKIHPEILEITREENFQLPGQCPEHDWVCTFMNLNLFHGITEFIGGKTGYTNAAGNTFVGAFKVEENPYTIVLLNTKSRTNDTQKIYEWLKKRPEQDFSMQKIETKIKQN